MRRGFILEVTIWLDSASGAQVALLVRTRDFFSADLTQGATQNPRWRFLWIMS